MLNKSKFYETFILLVLASPFLGYFSNSGIIAYGPIITFLLLISLIELNYPSSMKKSDWISVFIWVPYTVWAGLNYILNPLDGRYLTTQLLSIICLPFFVLSFQRLRNDDSFNYIGFIYRIIKLFLFAQLIICLGQLSTYIFGIGLSVTEAQADYSMIAGTFSNSNDLGGVVLLIIFVYLSIEKYLKIKSKFVWIIIAILLVISGSRSALLLGFLLFIVTRKLSPKNTIIYSAVFYGIYLTISLLWMETNIEVISRFSDRIDSLFKVLNGGVENDGSISLRIESYIHFLTNIDKLGFGSGQLENYYKYANNAKFETFLIFQNPHSLIVEVGYWLGYPGLIFLVGASLYLFKYSNRKILLALVLSVSTLIPSSVLGSLIYFLYMISAFFPPLYSVNYTRSR